jgi:CheY-like chemotaxis protein
LGGTKGRPSNTPIPLTFSISDTGPGISPSEQASLFEAFSQTSVGKYASEGTGLGLPISQKMLSLLESNFQVDSPLPERPARFQEGGPGTKFSFTLLVETDPTAESALALTHNQPDQALVVGVAPDQPRYRLLIVDDNPSNRQLLSQLFSALNFELFQAENGQEAIEIWRTAQPHLILMDMKMPQLDGYEATRQIRHHEAKHPQRPQCAIIALTASSFIQDKDRILAAGCDDFLSKPFVEADLFKLISKYLGIRFIYNDDVPTSGPPPSASHIRWAELDPTVRQELIQAIRLADVQHLEALLLKLEADWPDLVARIKPLLDDFQYNDVLRLLNST